MDCHRPTEQVVSVSIRLYTLQGTPRSMAPCLSNVLFPGWTLEARNKSPNSVLPGCVTPRQPISSVSERRDWIWAKVGEIEVPVPFPPPCQLSPRTATTRQAG